MLEARLRVTLATLGRAKLDACSRWPSVSICAQPIRSSGSSSQPTSEILWSVTDLGAIGDCHVENSMAVEAMESFAAKLADDMIARSSDTSAQRAESLTQIRAAPLLKV
eukprot:SAG31_NODE_23395_length_505_cov_1.017241_1_plen_108_part_10